MNKKLISFDKSGYEGQVSSMKDVKEKSQNLIDSFNKLCIGEFEPEKFNILVFNTEQYLFENTMKDVPLKVNGLQLSKQQFYDMVEKPAGYFKLKIAAADFIQFLENRIKYKQLTFSPEQYLRKCLQFSKSGELEANQDNIEDIKEKHSVYIHTESGSAIFDIASKFASLINENKLILKKLPGNTKDNFMKELSNLINYPGNLNEDVTVNVNVVKLFDK